MADDFDADLKDFDADIKAPAPKPEPSFWQKAGDVLGISKPSDATAGNLLMAAQNGATWGLAPKINAAGETALRTIGHGLAPDSIDDTTYADALKKSQKMYGDASAAHPVVDLVGSLPTGGPEVKGASFLGRAAKMGGAGALQAATRAYGKSPEEGPQALANAGTETAIGGGLGALLGGVTGPWGRQADDMALRATGLKGGITNKLQNMGYETADDARELGHAIRKEGLVPWFGTSHDVADRAAALKSSAGQRIGSAVDAADASGVRPDFQAPVVAARKGLMRETPVLRQAGGKLSDFLNTLEQTPKQLVDESGLQREATFRDLNQSKSDAWKAANMSTEAQGAAPLYRQGVGRVAGDIQRQVESAAGPKVAGELAQGNRQYGLARDVQRITNDVNTRDAHKFGLPEIMAAGAGGVLGGPALGHGAAAGGLGSAASVLATKYARSHGPAFISRLSQLAEPLEGRASRAPGVGSLAEYLDQLKEKENP